MRMRVRVSKQIWMVVSVLLAGMALAAEPASFAAVPTLELLESYGSLPLHFEPNLGQFDPQVRYVARLAGYTLFLTDSEAVMMLSRSEKRDRETLPREPAKVERAVVRLKLVRSRKPAKRTGLERFPGITNYFLGNDPTKWYTNIANYGQVRFQDVYPGVDLIYYGNEGRLEYDFVVRPGGDPEEIGLALGSAESIRADESGDLVLQTPLGRLCWKKPVAYQEENGIRQPIEAAYVLKNKRRVAFEVGQYDPSNSLVIDPVIEYSTYLGGSDTEGRLRSALKAAEIAVDAEGNVYVTGNTQSADFPTTSGSLQPSTRGLPDAYVVKFDTTGRLVYSTYLGGSDTERGFDIAVDSRGSAYVTGRTQSFDFPTIDPAQANLRGNEDAFVTRLSPDGSAILYSTYLGGSDVDYAFGIDVDAQGNACVVGNTSSWDFPLLNPIQAVYSGEIDAFVSILDATGSAIVYSTYLGGTHADYASAVAAGSDGIVYVAGGTASPDFPLKDPLKSDIGGLADTYVVALLPSGGLLYSTLIGGIGGEAGTGVVVDGSGKVTIVGTTDSTDFPLVSPLQPTYGGGSSDAFVARLDEVGGSLVFSSYLGGSHSEEGYDVAVDPAGYIYLGGTTTSDDFPVFNPLQETLKGVRDAFVAKLDERGGAPYVTYLGGSGLDYAYGIAADSGGNAYVAGRTDSLDFPTANAAQAGNTGGLDSFVTKLAPSSSEMPAPAFSSAGLANAASYAGGAVAPCEIITIFGAGIGPASLTTMELTPDGQYVTKQLANTRVLFDGIAAPLIYVSSTQTSAVVPIAVAGKDTTEAQIEYMGVLSDPVTLPVALAIPGIFTLDASGNGQGAILHWPDYSVNGPGNPAARRSVIMVFATSGGLMQPPGEDGKLVTEALALQLPVTATIGGVPAAVSYAGGAPTLVTGVLQVNLTIPETAPTGDAVPLVITVGGVESQPEVTLAIQ